MEVSVPCSIERFYIVQHSVKQLSRLSLGLSNLKPMVVVFFFYVHFNQLVASFIYHPVQRPDVVKRKLNTPNWMIFRKLETKVMDSVFR